MRSVLPQSSRSTKERLPLLLTLGALSALMIVALAMILARCQGRFTYTIDDPYIHLALARGIAYGHYGINPSEPSAPSSNFVWPLMLAPFGRLASFDLVPLVYNAVFALLGAAATVACFAEIFRDDEDGAKPWRIAAWSIATVMGANGAAIVFTGMENPLQVYLTVLTAYGLIRVHKGEPAPRSLMISLVLAPLVRYENLALTFCCAAWLFSHGHRRIAATAVAVPLVVLAAFCVFLRTQGLGFVPTSMLAKSGILARLAGLVPPGVSTSTIIDGDAPPNATFFQLFWRNMGKPNFRPFWRFIVLVAIFGLPRIVGAARASRSTVGLWLVLVVPMLAQLTFSVSGLYRYQMYLYAFGVILLVYLRRQSPLVPLPRSTSLVGRGLIALFFGVFAKQTFDWYFESWKASASIYRQQHQMMRFARDFYRKPVGVNDLGEVSFGSGRYVLDVWGLASQDALRARLGVNNQSEWIGPVVARHDVGLVMIYDHWIPRRPTDWTLVGYLDLLIPPAAVSETRVSFYTTPTEDADRVRGQLAEFARTLPPGAAFELH